MPPGVPPTAPGIPGAWSPTEAVSFGWNAVMKNFAGVALPLAVAVLIAALPGAMIGIAYNLASAIVAEYIDASMLTLVGGLVQATSSFVGLCVGSYLAGGIATFALKVARGQPVQFGDIFSGGQYFGRMFVAGICVSILVSIGCCLLIVPGVIVSLGISQYQYLIVDQGLGGVDALKKSWEMTNGHKMNLFIFFLLAIGVSIAGYIACFIGVLLVSVPVLAIAAAYIYLSIKGETPRLAQS
jgi:uncharacterized membrane protein